MDWTFARIAQVLFGKPDPNLVATTYYRAKKKVTAWLCEHGYSEDDLR